MQKNSFSLLIKAFKRGFIACFIVLTLTSCAGILPEKPQAPTVSVAGVRPVSLSLLSQQLAFKLRVVNPNSFELKMKSIDFTATFAGSDFATGKGREEKTIPANGEAIVEVIVDAELNKILSQLQNMLNSASLKLDYGVKGYVKLTNWPTRIPFNFDGEVDPEKVL